MNKKTRELALKFLGPELTKLIKILKEQEYTSEYIIAEKLNKDINQTRGLLYQLSQVNLVTTEKQKDKLKGWYIYYWKFLDDNLLYYLYKSLKREKEKYEERIKEEKENTFFVCPNNCVRLTFDESLNYNFRCPECGEVLKEDNDKELINKLEKRKKELEEEIRNVENELRSIDEKKEKERARKLKNEEKKKENKKKSVKKKEGKKIQGDNKATKKSIRVKETSDKKKSKKGKSRNKKEKIVSKKKKESKKKIKAKNRQVRKKKQKKQKSVRVKRSKKKIEKKRTTKRKNNRTPKKRINKKHAGKKNKTLKTRKKSKSQKSLIHRIIRKIKEL